MKRLAIFLIVLLMGWAESAAADSAWDVMWADYSGAHIIAEAQDEQTAFFALDVGGDEPLLLLGYENIGGEWTCFLESNTALRPSGLSDMYTQWRYEELTLSLQEDNLSIICHGWPTWQYDFARNVGGEWHFQRLYVADDVNRMYDELTYSDGCVNQTFTRRFKDGSVASIEPFPPCPMPWLSGCETLAGFDASAFPMDLGGMLDADLTRVAAELLPEYTYVDGKFSTYAATFLMDNAAGERIFLGGVYEDGAWVWTKSTPLPADTFCDSYHGGAGTLVIGFAIPGSGLDAWGYPYYAEYEICLQEDGRWLVETMFNEIDEDYLHFEADGVSLNMTGLVYGECLLERDITKIDWAEYPISHHDVLDLMSHDWGVISDPFLPLYADAEGTMLLADYLCATPVKVLGDVDDQDTKNWEHHLVQVQIADSDVIGYLQGYAVLTGAYQVGLSYDDEDEEWFYYTTAEETEATWVIVQPGADLYSAPEGESIGSVQNDTWMMLMAEWPGGWAHVKYGESLESCFVRMEDCRPADE